MKKNFDVVKTVARAALAGNMNNDVATRMLMFITEQTTDDNIICALLQGLAIDVKIKDSEKLAEIVGNVLNENISEIKNLEVIIYEQDVRVTYICKRFAKTADEVKIYNTRREANDEYTFEVEVQDSYRVGIYDFDFENNLDIVLDKE